MRLLLRPAWLCTNRKLIQTRINVRWQSKYTHQQIKEKIQKLQNKSDTKGLKAEDMDELLNVYSNSGGISSDNENVLPIMQLIVKYKHWQLPVLKDGLARDQIQLAIYPAEDGEGHNIEIATEEKHLNLSETNRSHMAAIEVEGEVIFDPSVINNQMSNITIHSSDIVCMLPNQMFPLLFGIAYSQNLKSILHMFEKPSLSSELLNKMAQTMFRPHAALTLVTLKTPNTTTNESKQVPFDILAYKYQDKLGVAIFSSEQKAKEFIEASGANDQGTLSLKIDAITQMLSNNENYAYLQWDIFRDDKGLKPTTVWKREQYLRLAALAPK